MSAPALTIVFVGNSLTGGIPSGSSTTTGTQVATHLSTRLGMTINAQTAPWSGTLGGAQTTDDLPSDPRGTGNYAAAVALAAGTPPLYHVMLGSNDARYTSNSASLFAANLSTIVTNLVATGAKVILPHDPWFDAPSGGSSAALALLASYQPYIDALVDNTTVFLGDTTSWALFAANPGWLYDGIHPDAANGQPVLAAAWAAAIAPTICRYVQWTPPPAIGFFA